MDTGRVTVVVVVVVVVPPLDVQANEVACTHSVQSVVYSKRTLTKRYFRMLIYFEHLFGLSYF